jgi:hypothetical protein
MISLEDPKLDFGYLGRVVQIIVQKDWDLVILLACWDLKILPDVFD